MNGAPGRAAAAGGGVAAVGPGLGEYVGRHRGRRLVVQPRMGFGEPDAMRAGLLAVRSAGLPAAVGTVTLDSYTRQGQHDRAAMALSAGVDLNGYALVALGAERGTRMLEGVGTPDFPIQVRHGSPFPEEIFATMLEIGLTASEGGPASYSLPYGRQPLTATLAAWRQACQTLAAAPEGHLESFGGCMLGQLCPPALLVALSVLECVFFAEHGVASVSASYAQQTSAEQDTEALLALRALLAEHLPGVDWHVVLYTYMGLFPSSESGARSLLRDSARLAVRTGTERLIVKTTAEAHRIPTVAENVAALTDAHRAAAVFRPAAASRATDSQVYWDAKTLIDTVRGSAPSLAEALPLAFERGVLDVPFCLHPDNRNETRCVVGSDGRLEWWDVGRMPLRGSAAVRAGRPALDHQTLIEDLEYQRRRYDRAA